MTKPKKIKKEVKAWGIFNQRTLIRNESDFCGQIFLTKKAAQKQKRRFKVNPGDKLKVAPIKITYYTNGKS